MLGSYTFPTFRWLGMLALMTTIVDRQTFGHLGQPELVAHGQLINLLIY